MAAPDLKLRCLLILTLTPVLGWNWGFLGSWRLIFFFRVPGGEQPELHFCDSPSSVLCAYLESPEITTRQEKGELIHDLHKARVYVF